MRAVGEGALAVEHAAPAGPRAPGSRRARPRAAPPARATSPGRLRVRRLLAPLELPLQEFERQRRVGLADRVDAVQPEQVLRALHRILQRAVGLVDARGRLQREALLRVAAAGEAVGMHFGLQLAVGAVERRAVEAEAGAQAEQLEVVAGEIDHPNPPGRRGRCATG